MSSAPIFILPLDTLDATLERVGGKSLNLGTMTRAGLPVSTSQAIVGAIIGWNLYSGFPTDTGSLIKIVGTWVACPLLAGVIGVVLFKATTAFVSSSDAAKWKYVKIT